MARYFKEVASMRTDKKKFDKNYDAIFKKKTIPVESYVSTFKELKDRNKLYYKAARKYGVKNQTIAATEELAELIVELAKVAISKRDPSLSADRYKLVDELADARIMIEQIQYNYDLTPEVDDRMIIKLTKLEETINE